MKRLLASVLLVIGLAGSTGLFADSEPRQLLARSISAAAPLQLGDQDRQWLQQRGRLVLGSSRPDYPPFEINISQHDYEGLSADYAGIIAEQLGVPIEVRRFDNRHQAIAALRDGRIERERDDRALTFFVAPDFDVVVLASCHRPSAPNFPRDPLP